MSDSPVLAVRDLSVSFGALKALDSVSLSVGPGERVALLGHNGAGKSTLFKAVLGFLGARSGDIEIVGAAPGSSLARQAISYLPESVAFPKTLTGAELMTYFARLKSVSPREALKLLDVVGLRDAGKRRVGTYSKGMRQRLGLAQALIGQPRLLLLDEPTSGLDPISRSDFYHIIDGAAALGTAVLLSSHALTEVEGKTDRVAILSHGRLVAQGTLPELAAGAALPITITVRAVERVADKLAAELGGTRMNGRSVVLSCTPQSKLKLMGRLAAQGGDVEDFDIAMPGLDDIYRHYSVDPRKGEPS